MPANFSDSITPVSRKPTVIMNGLDAVYDIAIGHDIDASSSASSEFCHDNSAEQLKQEKDN